MNRLDPPYTSIEYRLNVPPEKYVENYWSTHRIAISENPLTHPDNIGGNGHNNLWFFTVNDACKACQEYYLRGYWSKAIEWADRAGEAFEQYFFGAWQESAWYDQKPPGDGKWFEEGRPWVWLSFFEMDIPWLAVSRRWRWLDRIMEFPRPELAVDNNEAVERRYYLGLARWWRDRSDLAGFDELLSKGGSGSKQYRLLFDVAQAITERDESALVKTVTKCLQHFLKQRCDPEHIPHLPLVLVWGAARRDGLLADFPPGPFPDELAKWLFEIPASYWATHREPSPDPEPGV